MTDIFLYDTASRSRRRFVPANRERVTMYVCGPTVYGPAHIGNFRPAVVFDVLFRLLREAYGADHVAYARNFTDVDDKINAAAASEGVDISVITDRFTKIYHADSDALGIMRPTFEPTATGHMAEMIAMISGLIEAGHAYEAEGHVLFSVKSYEAYGRLSGRSLDEMIAGARVEVAPYKKDAADFVLWKPSKPGEPVWEAPFGAGRPGWHIECSAMIAKTLGETIDIHGGGIDLVFPHHENEVAQSACAHGKPLANYWLHNGFLSMDTEKMSKSLGNVIRPSELIARGIRGEVIRYGLLTGHYRAPLDWNDKLIEQSRKALDRLYGVLRRLGDVEAADVPVPASVLEALGDDINTPKAFAAVFEILARANKAASPEEKSTAKGELLAAGRVLGFPREEPDSWFGLDSIDADRRAEIDALLNERQAARVAKDFAKADLLRAQIDLMGILVDDTPEGPVWRMKAIEEA
ncbi:cysteinyl-tRNA synthetase [Glycocaulis alkaliphilus]|uniref:Cysteine--tRNA ligase n=1 Tax=Glycocaulis alkaliphilus TaxID=1434191 RepID=A0A3T0E6B3_9PROT|nr:cysteine--tRNA ligase [Glycocaulis alkaliphilus]AZU02911.1 cysteinyl-tRNA synthetase [Glycocaulis alkaliphilus]